MNEVWGLSLQISFRSHSVPEHYWKRAIAGPSHVATRGRAEAAEVWKHSGAPQRTMQKTKRSYFQKARRGPYGASTLHLLISKQT